MYFHGWTGSSAGTGRDLGLVDVRGPDAIDILILTQTHAAVGAQIQHQYRYVLRR